MAYDQGLAQRIREAMADELGLSEREMFGGIGFMLNGNMACGVIGEDLMVRVGADRYQEALDQPGVRLFDMTGRPMKGWVVVDGGVAAEDDAFGNWVAWGVETARGLPAKAKVKKA
jgi:hypothetical protein